MRVPPSRISVVAGFPAVVIVLLAMGGRPAMALDMAWVSVGDAGNGGDGSVAYDYRIAKYEVTNSQYAEFLNAVDRDGANPLALYDAAMTSAPMGGINFDASASAGAKYSVKPARGNNPVTYVNWYDAARFANWMNNGQGRGGTEAGAYTLLGGSAVPSNPDSSVTRNPAATVFLPSREEWNKAAYYRGGGTNAGYWFYATRSDTSPVSDQPPGAVPTNAANFLWDDGNAANGVNDGYAVTGSPTLVPTQNYLTDVGAYALSPSAYGTFDQNGNVREWVDTPSSALPSWRRAMGGSWRDDTFGGLGSFPNSQGGGESSGPDVGFRVASVAVPEPTGALSVLALVSLCGRRHRAVAR